MQNREEIIKLANDQLPEGGMLMFLTISGSHSYRLETEKSDVDYKGVYIQSKKDILSNNYIPQINVNNDFVLYELRRFIELAIKANPNVIELLYIDDEHILHIHPYFNLLKAIRSAFLTKDCFNTYARYAKSQLQKSTSTNKKYNWDEVDKKRRSIIDFATIMCSSTKEEYKLVDWLKENEYDASMIGLSKMKARDSYKLYIDEIKFAKTNHRFEHVVEDRNYRGFGEGNEPVTSEIESYMKNQVKGVVYWNREAYSTHCKKYLEYEKWKINRNENRVATNKEHGQQFDSKNIMHLYRLLLVAESIVKENTIQVNQIRNRNLLLDIKHGKVDLKQIIKDCELKVIELEKLFESSNLPNEVEINMNYLEYSLRECCVNYDAKKNYCDSFNEYEIEFFYNFYLTSLNIYQDQNFVMELYKNYSDKTPYSLFEFRELLDNDYKFIYKRSDDIMHADSFRFRQMFTPWYDGLC